MNASEVHVLILAAGQGKRMRSKLPKVAHPVLFKPMLQYVIEAAESVKPQSISVVIGHGAEVVEKVCAGRSGLQFFHQKQQLGTGHAVGMAADYFAGKAGTLLILSGDVILLSTNSVKALLATHLEAQAAATLMTAIVPSPQGYGRILRHSSGDVLGIREEADCNATEKKLAEVNAGVYCFRIPDLFSALKNVDNKNRQGEYYLPDAVSVLLKESKRIATYPLSDWHEMTGINDRRALSEVETRLRNRICDHWNAEGVTFRHRESTWVDADTKFGPDTIVEGNCTIIGSTIGEGVHIEQGCRIEKCRIGNTTHLKQGCYLTESEVGAECALGPYAHLRPGSKLDAHVKLGNFVEVKKSHFSEGAKASHLSYIGDAEIGKDVNLGCGFITCNFDGGPKKHTTVIEDGVFVGSDSQTVAPVKIGRGSYVASGTTVTEDVPPHSLVLSRGKQTTKVGYAKKYKKE